MNNEQSFLLQMYHSSSLRINRIYQSGTDADCKFQPEGKRIMPETRFTQFPRVGISRSASDIFLTMTLKFVIYHSSFLSFLTFYAPKRTFPNAIRCFSRWCKSDVSSEIKSSNVTFRRV